MVSLVDGALHHLGKPGGFHLLVAILLCCNFFPITFHHMSMVFYGESIPHTCRLPEGWPWHKKFSIPKVNNGIQSKFDECHMFVDPNSAALGTKSCVYGWEFYPQGREWTIIAEWGLVCERDYLVTLAAVVYHGGVMFGGLVFGTLADKFGRKPLMLFTLYAQTAISIGIYFVQNFILFVILRFVHGLLLQGLQCSTICLVMELLPMRYRTAAGMGCSIVWGLGMISLSLVSYSVQHWRYIQLAISLPCIVTFLYIWLIPESVRWLLTVQKTEKALLTAQKFEQFNKRPLGENFSKDVETATKQVPANAGQVESYGMRELLLQGSKLRISSLVLCFCWFATSSLYHGLSVILLEVGSNRYTSLVIIGCVDLVAFIVMYFLLVRFGRKRPICALLVLCGAICISTVVAENLEIGHSLEVYVVSTVLTLVERSCAAACLAGLTICAAELFPTVIRTFGIGVCLFCGQFGWLMAPQILKLSQFSLKALPWITFGILSLLAGLLVLLLPETLTKPLPDTLEDMENFESRKAAIVSKDKEAATPPAYGQDWATTYKQKIEEANGNLTTMEAEDHKEVNEKRWYARNHSRRSAKVVRFYGLDCSEDPCQEVKTNKRERIRMVRFSFESEELPKFRSTPCAPMAVARFSAIKEEPELETALDEDTAGSSLDEEKDEDAPLYLANSLHLADNTVIADTVDILSVSSALDANVCPSVESLPVSENSVDRKPRFLVQKVSEPPPQAETVILVKNECQFVPEELHVAEDSSQPDPSQSLFHPQETSDSSSIADSSCETLMEISVVESRSRFLVQKVEEEPAVIALDTSVNPIDDDAAIRDRIENSSGNIVPTVCETDNVCGAPSGVMLRTDELPVAVEKKSRFLVQKVEEMPLSDACRTDNVLECSSTAIALPLVDGKPSRFVVQKVLEQPATNDLHKTVEDVEGGLESSTVPVSNCKPSRFVVQKVLEQPATNNSQKPAEDVRGGHESSTVPVSNCKPSRFVVQRVAENQLQSVPQETADSVSILGKCVEETVDPPLKNGKASRFTVQKVPEDQVAQNFADANGNVEERVAPLAAPVNGKPSRFRVQKVPEKLSSNTVQNHADANSNVIECSPRTTAAAAPSMNGKPSRFVVQRVAENTEPVGVRKPEDSNSNIIDGSSVDSKPSRFTVRRVSDSKLLQGSQFISDSAGKNLNGAGAVNGTKASAEPKSRFLVQRVADDVLKVVHLNNNNVSNKNNKNNSDHKLALEKMLDAPFSENIENVHQVALTNGNSAAVPADIGNAQVLKLHLKHADIAANS